MLPIKEITHSGELNPIILTALYFVTPRLIRALANYLLKSKYSLKVIEFLLDFNYKYKIN
jgi:hypothetical protein